MVGLQWKDHTLNSKIQWKFSTLQIKLLLTGVKKDPVTPSDSKKNSGLAVGKTDAICWLFLKIHIYVNMTKRESCCRNLCSLVVPFEKYLTWTWLY
jgi:hypothetical protein